MRNGKALQLNILFLAMLVLLFAWPALAESGEPLTLTVEADPDCLLSEAGEMTYFRFALKNNLDEDYDVEALTLRGDLLDEPKSIVEFATIKANDVLEFSLERVWIEEDELDRDLSFLLTWQTIAFSPDDEEHLEPIVTEHAIAASVRIERFIEPVMTLSFSPDVMMAREGDTVTVTYTLINDTKFDMTNISLQDEGIPQMLVPLEKNVLFAGEWMQATAAFPMGGSVVELSPTVQYTVRGVESRVDAAQTVTVELVEVNLRMEVEKYPATAEGTQFFITLINNGTHPVTDIRLTDEIGTPIADGIALEAGAERMISYTAPSAVASNTVRYIAFLASGYDCLGSPVSVRSPSDYELLPFVEYDQVELELTVSLTSSVRNDDGSNRLKLMFVIRNDSQVPIHNAVITEGESFMNVVKQYDALSTGSTPLIKEITVPADTRSLTFFLTAMDPAQNQYVAKPVTLDLSELAAPKPTSQPAIKPGKTVDTTGTIYDTERYSKLFRMSALIALALTLMFLLLSVIFRVAEMNIRRWLPKEPVLRPFGPRKAAVAAGKEAPKPAHNPFGYMQPAKLRYMERTDRLPVVGREEEPKAPSALPTFADTGSIATKPLPTAQRSLHGTRREGEITNVPSRKSRPRPVMMSSDDTLPFAPVHEGQAAEAPAKTRVVQNREPEVETQVIRMREPEAETQVIGMREREEESFRPFLEEETFLPFQPAAEEPAQREPRVIEIKPAPRVLPRQKIEIIRVVSP